MKVYKYTPEYEYGGGVVLVAAPSTKEAQKAINREFSKHDTLKYRGIVHGLTSDLSVSKGVVVINELYIE